MLHVARTFMVLFLLSWSGSFAFGQVNQADLRAQISGAGETLYIDVSLASPVKVGTSPRGAVFDANGQLLTKSLVVPGALRDRIRFDLPVGASPLGLTVAIFEYENENGVTHARQVAAKSPLGVKLTTGNPSCVEKRGQYFSIYVKPPFGTSTTGDLLQRLYDVYDQLAAKLSLGGNVATLEVEPETQKDKSQLKIKSIQLVPQYKTRAERGTNPGRSIEEQVGLFLCIATERPPTDQYDAAFTFSGTGVPFELQGPILATELPGFSNIDVSSAGDDTGEVGTRSLEKNLDLAVSLTSSVEDKEVADATGQTTKVRTRTTRGTFDIRFAPWLNAQLGYEPPRTGDWRSFYTPIFIDAKVSTGPILDDTLSLNRIVIGTEKEYRYQQNTDRFPTFFRVNLRGSHASDRDFKQGEYKFGGEFIPNFGLLVQPIESHVSAFPHQLDDDPNRGVKLIPGVKGYAIRPIVGFEVGRTYFRRNPAAAVTPSETVRRLYFGAEIGLDLTERLNLKLTDTMYVRGESKSDRLHNYFSGEINFLVIGRRWSNTGSSVFLSFERGGQPPFATPDVNVFKIGYRIQSRNWFDSFR